MRLKIIILLQFIYIIGFSQTLKSPVIQQPKTPPTLPSIAPFFDKSKPVCIVLIHGVTNSIPTSQRLIDEGKAPNRPVNTLKFARHTWDYSFVQGLLGLGVNDLFSGSVGGPLFTLSDCSTSGALNSSPDAWETSFVNNNSITDHFITGSGCPAVDATGPSGAKGYLTVMLTYRDGSLSLKKQAAAASAQIKRLYDEMFGSWLETKRPQLILVCHSGGGLVARTICSKPAGLGNITSSLGNTPLPVENFSQTELNNMEFIRNHTLYVVTLATPHEGAPIAKVADQIGKNVSLWGRTSLPAVLFGINPAQDITNQDPQIPIMMELCPNVMQSYNQGPLHPSKCKRGDGSLIPIYCLGGRTAGGPLYYKDPNQYDGDLATPDGGIPYKKDDIKSEHKINGLSNRNAYEAYGLLQADYITTLLYGITTYATLGTLSGFDFRMIVTPSDNPQLDIVKIRNNGLTGCLDPPVYNLVDFGLGPKFFYLRNSWTGCRPSSSSPAYANGGASTAGDGAIDCDGFVPIISALGVNLGTTTKNFMEHTNANGSWYRFYRSDADYDNHGSITTRGAVGSFVRKNITTLNYLSNHVLDSGAGPYVKTTGDKSSWVK